VVDREGAFVGYLLEYPLDGGGSVAVEAADDSRVVRGWRAEEATAKATESLESAISRVRPAADVLISSFRDSVQTPTDIELEFGIVLTAEAGAVIARTQGEVHFRVTVRWSRE
jgi:NTP-dependent ternary system trypsin peptidase co-occuring protein